MCAREGVLIADRRQPRLHEIGAERQNVARAGEVVRRDGGRAERDPVPLTQRLERERLVGDVPPADLLHPGVHQLPERAALEPSDECDAFAARLLHLRLQATDRVVPGELLPLSVRSPRHRIGHAVGIVEPLQRGLAARAEPALVDRRLGVPLELDHATFAYLGVQPASGRALATRGGIVGRDPGHLVLGRHDVRDEVLGRLRADIARRGRGGGAAGRSQHGQEPSAIHRGLSSDTACSRARHSAARGS